MGAKQSKRSVDISGKEAEGAGEVAAAGAGGEGRVEPIADADALKPQLNGDAHIQPPQDLSDKEKQLDSGTPENEKDATTEKEGKEEQNEEKEITPVTNGDSEPKEENGDSVPTPEDGKKPKKEKVKKKWSLRSISFSRKDKPKQEKKPKEEEPKTNGEPEKVPEEAAEATPEAVENKITDAAPAETEVKEQKTPETPVTEPMTNGSSTPESPKVETLAADEPPAAPAPAPVSEPAPSADTLPEQLPVNGLSLDEPKKEPEVAPPEENKSEKPTADTTETVPAPEIPVKTEVCAAKMPLIEPTPPPLPANPPPSSVASFAATTMAPELIEASLANTTENTILTPPAIPDTTVDKSDENKSKTEQTDNTNLAITELSPPLKETVSEDTPLPTTTNEIENEKVPEIVTDALEIIKNEQEAEVAKIQPEAEKVLIETENEIQAKKPLDEVIKTQVEAVDVCNSEPELENKIIESVNAKVESCPVVNANGNQSIEMPSAILDNVSAIEKEETETRSDTNNQIPEPTSDIPNSIDDLPPPPPPEDCPVESDEVKLIDSTENVLKEIITNDNHNIATEANGITEETEKKNLRNKKIDALGNIVIDQIECNGNAVSSEGALSSDGASATPELSMPASPSDTAAPASDASDSLPPPPPPGELREPSPPPQPDLADLDSDSLHPQEPLPIADKIANLIPEIPTVPELKTETETSTEVAVAD